MPSETLNSIITTFVQFREKDETCRKNFLLQTERELSSIGWLVPILDDIELLLAIRADLFEAGMARKSWRGAFLGQFQPIFSFCENNDSDDSTPFMQSIALKQCVNNWKWYSEAASHPNSFWRANNQPNNISEQTWRDLRKFGTAERPSFEKYHGCLWSILKPAISLGCQYSIVKKSTGKWANDPLFSIDFNDEYPVMKYIEEIHRLLPFRRFSTSFDSIREVNILSLRERLNDVLLNLAKLEETSDYAQILHVRRDTVIHMQSDTNFFSFLMRQMSLESLTADVSKRILDELSNG